jgi:hypothetical protein
MKALAMWSSFPRPKICWISQRLRHTWHRLFHFSRREPLILLTLLLVAGAIWTFADLADEVLEGDTQAFDQAVLLAIRTPGVPSDPWGPRWLEEFSRDVTALGSAVVLTLLIGSSLSILACIGRRTCWQDGPQGRRGGSWSGV